MNNPGKKILFLRRFKKVTGGQIKVRDYFSHCLAHPKLDPYVYFTKDSTGHRDEIWTSVPESRLLDELRIDDFEIIFLAGKDWDLLPSAFEGRKIINLIQHVRHGDPDDPRFRYLGRPAFRICVSQEVHDAIAPYALGESIVVTNGIPLDAFNAGNGRVRDSILVLAGKNRRLGKILAATLGNQGLEVALLTKPVTRAALIARMAESDIFVALPRATEGFYLPALEAMASGCAVVCSDAVGNRGFCIDGTTCLTPEFDDYEGHLAAIKRVLRETALRERIRQLGMRTAQGYSLAKEREYFNDFLCKVVFN